MARAEHLTDEELATAKVPLSWFRDALRELREELKTKTMATTIHDYITVGEVPDPLGVTYQWMGDETYVKVGRTSLLLKYADMVWFDDAGACWLDTIYCPNPDPVLSQCRRVDSMTKKQYQEALRERRVRYCPADVQTINLGQPASPLAALGVRITRLG